MIRIYNGFGTSRIAPTLLKERFNEQGLMSAFINHDDIKAGHFIDTTNLLIFAGQSVTQFKESLGKTGLENIKDYVRQGGQYLGICAGGYFGAKETYFKGLDKKKGLYTISSDGLGFFDGLAKGSLTEISKTPFTGMSNSAAVITLKTFDGIDFKTLYWGGPQFIVDKNDLRTKVISQLQQHNKPPLNLGIQCDIGQDGGRATLLGYHPEITKVSLKRWVLPDESIVRNTKNLNQQARIQNVDHAFGILLQHLNLPPKQKPPQNLAMAR